ncbi:hypothetical protein EG349_13085 [Chryseobacterium shandongense]|jgi:uncharacterized protein involved in cysteine biosynthesis|uniref:Iron reductase n=1 Tax=Chryseobacterium shandongense TaxID=1493872 RepID=A0AAD0YF80_9FLAO|nr:hypothetical protein [Chryseobacterium shandongense]AZA87659.1 hypothetical protein EG349_13085 [Chryseobacterium shandongense]AZA96158.1 hypothetical protein EG353_11545 [Chryseobacterium shandongense]
MKQERTIIGSMLLLQIILWLGFLVHRSPAFPGSLAGVIIAILAALLMTIPAFIYSATKHFPSFKEKITKYFSLGKMLSWHVYTSIIGAIFAIIHTGHRFESNLGIWLTVTMMLSVLSGFVGRYFLSYSSTEIKEKQAELNLLATEYNQLLKVVGQPVSESVNIANPPINSLAGTKITESGNNSFLGVRAVQLTESIADLEYAIKTQQLLKRRTLGWLTVHIVSSIAFYVLLILHIWSAIHFGLRFLK